MKHIGWFREKFLSYRCIVCGYEWTHVDQILSDGSKPFPPCRTWR